MAVDAQMVVDAQKSRGLELEKGSFMKKIRNYIPILIPLIICAIRRSIELAEALESRAFGAANKRTPVMTLKMKPSDYAVIVLTLASLAFLTYLNLYVKLPEIDIPIRMPLIWSTAALSV
jgi:energy-coupling factor transport system permease protein